MGYAAHGVSTSNMDHSSHELFSLPLRSRPASPSFEPQHELYEAGDGLQYTAHVSEQRAPLQRQHSHQQHLRADTTDTDSSSFAMAEQPRPLAAATSQHPDPIKQSPSSSTGGPSAPPTSSSAPKDQIPGHPSFRR